MLPEFKHPTTEVLRSDAEAKLIEGRNKFLGFLRKRLNSPQDAEDVFQNFCVKVLRSYGTIKNGEWLDAWLGTTLRHALTDHYRRRATQNRGAEAYANESKILGLDIEDFEAAGCCCVTEALQKLDHDQTELLTRIDLQDESRKAVAADLGVSLNALGVRVYRSRAALRIRIAEFCPTCGEGRFMQCDCGQSQKSQSFVPLS
jgi:RNA polymerase sigma factor (sigma-70 family)